MHPSQDCCCDRLRGKKGTWSRSTRQQRTHQHTHTLIHLARTAPTRSCTAHPHTITPKFTSDSFCGSLNASFPLGLSLSPLSLRLLMIGTSMSSACMASRSCRFGAHYFLLLLHLRGWRIPVRHWERHREGGAPQPGGAPGRATGAQVEDLPPPPPFPPAPATTVTAAAPLFFFLVRRLIHCPRAPREGGVREPPPPQPPDSAELDLSPRVTR